MEAGAWTRVILRTGELRMSNEEFQLVARNRVLAPHPFIDGSILCPCGGGPVDVYGRHLQNCKQCHDLVYAIHDAVKFEVAELCRTAGLSVKVEPSGVTDRLRPDLLVERHDARPLGLDVSITNA